MPQTAQVASHLSIKVAGNELLRIMDRIGAEADRRGLTDEKLAELLKDES